MTLNNIYVYAIIIFFCPLIGKLIKSILDFHKLSQKYSAGNTLLSSLLRLTPREFQIWCSDYLLNLGYTDIILSPKNLTYCDDSSFILCSKKDISYYVQCKKNSMDKLITSSDVEQLLGMLISKNLYDGIILSTTPPSTEVVDFINELPTIYNIKIISLSDLHFN